MNKTDLIQKIKQLEGISQDESYYLINLVYIKKKYGLVWEDKPKEMSVMAFMKREMPKWPTGVPNSQ